MTKGLQAKSLHPETIFLIIAKLYKFYETLQSLLKNNVLLPALPHQLISLALITAIISLSVVKCYVACDPPFFWGRVSNSATLLLHLLHFEVIFGKVAEFLHQSRVSAS